MLDDSENTKGWHKPKENLKHNVMWITKGKS